MATDLAAPAKGFLASWGVPDTSARWSGEPTSSAMSPSSSASSSSSAASSSSDDFPPSPVALATRLAPLVPNVATDDWDPDGFTLKLLFTSPHTNSTTLFPRGPDADEEDDNATLPPAFFPAARISFAPSLRITSPKGVPFTCFGGLHLGVTGMCETLDSAGRVVSKRMLADFCTDLTSGLKIWKRDAGASRKRVPTAIGEERLPAGTYVLPLSMKIPNSERLPPSFECAQFRITYTMSIALFSSALSSNGIPRRLKVFSIPFHVLPSTLPTPPPELPTLTHDHRKSVFSSIIKSFPAFLSPKATPGGYHIVYPSLPTSHYSPASHASIPVSLRIVDRPLEPTDLYIRLAIVRKTYVRESTSTSMAAAIEDEWGLGAGREARGALGYPEEVIVEPWCREEEEVVSRWGYVPYSSRPGADPSEKAEVIIQDIALPLSGLAGEGWSHGYSTGLDLEPTPVPNLLHGDCSWFSPAFRIRPPVVKEYGKHIHVSSRFFLSIEVGFAAPTLREVLAEIGAASPDMEIPPPNGFTAPQRPSVSAVSGASLSNPFYVHNPRTRKSLPLPTPTLAQSIFPGRLRELFIPLTIGSVAEPAMSCIATAGETALRRAEREEREERGEDTRAEGEGPEGAWLCAPPHYEDALRSAPAYV